MRSWEERFWAKVERRRKNQCWLWLASLRGRGYGQFGGPLCHGAHGAAHRISWLIHFGPIPDGLFVLHHCDNPRCVNPSHLFLGTHQDNMADRDAKNRVAHGERHYRATTSAAKVGMARRMFSAGSSIAEITAATSLSRRILKRVIEGKQWKRAPGPISEVPTTRKLTMEDAQIIRRRRADGEFLTAIAADFGIDQSMVSLIASGKRFRPLTDASVG